MGKKNTLDKTYIKCIGHNRHFQIHLHEISREGNILYYSLLPCFFKKKLLIINIYKIKINIVIKYFLSVRIKNKY